MQCFHVNILEKQNKCSQLSSEYAVFDAYDTV